MSVRRRKDHHAAIAATYWQLVREAIEEGEPERYEIERGGPGLRTWVSYSDPPRFAPDETYRLIDTEAKGLETLQEAVVPAMWWPNDGDVFWYVSGRGESDVEGALKALKPESAIFNARTGRHYLMRLYGLCAQAPQEAMVLFEAVTNRVKRENQKGPKVLMYSEKR